MIIKPKNRSITYQEDIENIEDNIVEEVKEDVVEDTNIVEKINISNIVSTLMAAKVNFHVLHFQTKSHAKHLALGDLYEDITEKADDIIECLLGRFNTRIETGLIITCNPLVLEDTEQNILDHINIFSTFADEAFNWANSNNYQDIANLFAEVISLVNKTKYRLSLC